MTDRTITLGTTEAEKFAALAVGESMWIAREGDGCTCSSDGGTWAGGGGFPLSCPICHDADSVPPVEFVQACAPCERNAWGLDHGPLFPCVVCRIELVGPCPNCNGDGWWVDADPDPRTGEPGEPYQVFCQQCGEEGDGAGIVTLGHAYAVGEPLPICAELSGVALPRSPFIFISGGRAFLVPASGDRSDIDDNTDALAHYGPPESLDGQWAIEVRKA